MPVHKFTSASSLFEQQTGRAHEEQDSQSSYGSSNDVIRVKGATVR
jgi:hypothetical protein